MQDDAGTILECHVTVRVLRNKDNHPQLLAVVKGTHNSLKNRLSNCVLDIGPPQTGDEELIFDIDEVFCSQDGVSPALLDTVLSGNTQAPRTHRAKHLHLTCTTLRNSTDTVSVLGGLMEKVGHATRIRTWTETIHQHYCIKGRVTGEELTTRPIPSWQLSRKLGPPQ
jgi:hypothetical protein